MCWWCVDELVCFGCALVYVCMLCCVLVWCASVCRVSVCKYVGVLCCVCMFVCCVYVRFLCAFRMCTCCVRVFSGVCVCVLFACFVLIITSPKSVCWRIFSFTCELPNYHKSASIDEKVCSISPILHVEWSPSRKNTPSSTKKPQKTS